MTSGIVKKLILINVAVFVLISLVGLVYFIFNIPPSFSPAHWLSVPASPEKLLFKPWTLITYMFMHEGLFHILGNMIMLYFGGRIFTDFLNDSRLLPTYILGGIFGAFVYILAYNLFPVFDKSVHFSSAMGASASVLAIFFAIASYLPNYEVHLIIFGSVRLKIIALVILAIDLISIPKGNPGGHIAHLGGALYGFMYAGSLRRGNDWALVFNNTISKITNALIPRKKAPSRPKFKVEYNQNEKPRSGGFTTFSAKNSRTSAQQQNMPNKSKQEIIDEILDKISRSGYDSLTKEEKETIFRISKED
jgi:membrane associated rhomboid family serine protease